MPDAAGTAGPTARAMDQFTAEFQELLSELDPADRDELLADLQRTDRDLWPEIVYRFRAMAAYRNRSQHEGLAEARTGPSGAVVRPTGWTAPDGNRTPLQRADNVTQDKAATGRPTIDRLPAPDNTALPPMQPPPGNYPHTQGAPPAAQGVVPTGYHAAAAGDWQSQVSSAAAALESQLSRTPKTTDQQEAARQAAEHARLRMLYMLAGRRDDALQPIPSLPPSMQDFWSKQLFGLATWLDASGASESVRTANTQQILDEAVGRLGESAPLVVRNLSFCTKIVNYGCTNPFDKDEFTPGQMVLLYAEVENFATRQAQDGFHTALRSSYRIFDSHDRQVDSYTFNELEDHCQSQRRDFFITHPMYLPSHQVYPGRYTLVLTIEDLTSGKAGQSSIPFTVKWADRDR